MIGEKYHDSTIGAIQETFMGISPELQNVRIVYCPAHEGIEENELADSLAKTVSKKVEHLHTQLSPSEIQQGNEISKLWSISK